MFPYTSLKAKNHLNNTWQPTYAQALDKKTFSNSATKNTTMVNNFCYLQDMEWKKSEMRIYA